MTTAGRFTDAALARAFAEDRLVGRFRWAHRWARWDGTDWAPCPDEAVIEQARRRWSGSAPSAPADLAEGVGEDSPPGWAPGPWA